MLKVEIYGEYETAWCPGCGNHDILISVKQALALCDLPPEKVLMVSGIGQAAKAPHYLNAHVFNGLHGRALPAATGAKLANPELTVVVESGDGCLYGEGGNHFMAAIRRNINITVLAHNNSVYGLTKGQASPTSSREFVAPSQPFGIVSLPFSPIAVAIALGASFVGRGFSGDKENLPELIATAIRHQGIAVLDILTPCGSFNKLNTFGWYKKHVKPLPAGYDPKDKAAALALADSWDEGIYTGVIFQQEGLPTLESNFPVLKQGALARQPVAVEELQLILQSFM